jgi:hypothetical protein
MPVLWRQLCTEKIIWLTITCLATISVAAHSGCVVWGTFYLYHSQQWNCELNPRWVTNVCLQFCVCVVLYRQTLQRANPPSRVLTNVQRVYIDGAHPATCDHFLCGAGSLYFLEIWMRTRPAYRIYANARWGFPLNMALKYVRPVPVAAVEVIGLQPLACWDCGFESHRRHGCLSVVSVVCCQVEVPATDWSLVQRSPTNCGTLRVIKKPQKMRRLKPATGLWKYNHNGL